MTRSNSYASKQIRKEEKDGTRKSKILIEMINNMDIKDKLRLAICMSQSKWSGLIYNTKEYYEKFDSMLKDIDKEYRTTLINFGKYKLVMFAMTKLMEMETTEQNKVALYLYNNIMQITTKSLNLM